MGAGLSGRLAEELLGIQSFESLSLSNLTYSDFWNFFAEGEEAGEKSPGTKTE